MGYGLQTIEGGASCHQEEQEHMVLQGEDHLNAKRKV